MKTIEEVRALGGTIETGGQLLESPGNYVEPTIVSGLAHDCPLVLRESFVPVLYVIKLEGGLDEAIAINNEVEQGLSSSLFTRDLGNVFKWIGSVSLSYYDRFYSDQYYEYQFIAITRAGQYDSSAWIRIEYIL